MSVENEALWNKRERLQEVVGDMMKLAPPMLRSLLPLFTTQFQAQLCNIEEQDLDHILDYLQDRLDYIRGGEPDE